MDNQVKLNFNSEGYNPKDLSFGSDAQQKLISGISKLASAVKSTLGPRGHTVLIESPTHTRGVVVTKDGVTVAKSIDLLDPVENLAVRLMKEAADRTATEAGDGTSSSIVLAEAIIKAGVDYISPDINKTVVLRIIDKITADAVDYLRSAAIPLDQNRDMMDAVATISANNDPVIGGLISEVFSKVGKTGVVSVARSKTHKTYYDFTEGIKIDRPATSPMLLTDPRKAQWRAENVRIMVCDMELSNVMALSEVFKPFIADTKQALLIIAPVSQNFLNTIVANVIRANLNICIIEPPSFGYRRHELMQDIAISTGATLYSEKTGTDVTMMTINDLGTASSVVVDDTQTIISKEANDDDIKQRVLSLTEALDDVDDKDAREFLQQRIASLTGGVGTIFVGGKTDIEQKELYDRVDDAVCAVKSALEEGIVVGGGKALYNAAIKCSTAYNDSGDWCAEYETATSIMFDAMRTPMQTIMENAGLWDTYYKGVAVGGQFDDPQIGCDSKTGQIVELMQAGVVDPVKVVRCALENAVSVATTILSTNAIITMTRA